MSALSHAVPEGDMKLLVFIGSFIGLMTNIFIAMGWIESTSNYPTSQLISLFAFIAVLAIAER